MLELLVQLFNEDFGTVTARNEPGSLDEFTITRKRQDEASGFIFEFSVSLDFTKELASFIRSVYEAQGPDGVIGINIYSRNRNTYTNDLEYLGQLKLDNYNQTEAQVTTNVEPIGFERKFLNQLERPVAMDTATSRMGTAIGVAPVTVLPLAPKTILNQAIMKGPTDFILSPYIPGFYGYIRIGSPDNTNDFEEGFFNQSSWIRPNDVNQNAVSDRNFVLRTTQAGIYTIDVTDFTFDVVIDANTNNLTALDVDMFFQLNTTGNEISYFSQRINESDFDEEIPSPQGPGQTRWIKRNLSPSTLTPILILNLDAGEEIYFWFEFGVDYVGAGDSLSSIGYRFRENSEFSITANTIFPSTDCNGYMVFEFLQHMIRFLTDQVDVFRSDFFQRTDSSPAGTVDGPGSLLFITNGAAIRQLPNRRVFGSWEEAFQSLTSLYCLGWGFETLDDGTKILRCEPKDYFFDKDTIAFTADTIADLEFFLDTGLLYNEVLAGYPEIENINQVNGVDEFNSERTYAGPVINATTELDIRSVYRASGFEIESLRRLIGSTDESRLDDQNFMIVVKRATGGGFEVELGSDFTQITGVFDPDSAYNMRISPGRNILNWKKVLASTTVRNAEKIFRFASGTLNYLVTSQLPGESIIGESDDVVIADSDAIYYAEKYTLTTELTKAQRDAINANILGVFRANDWNGNQFEGFFEEVQANLAKQEGNLTLLRVYRDG